MAGFSLAQRRAVRRGAVVGLLVLAFALRVYRLDAQSLWYDEAVTAQVVQQGLPELARWTADDIQPPLYYAVVAGWTRLAGVGEGALRFPSAWFGVAMVALAYALGRRLFGPLAGLLTALMAAVHPLWVYYSQEARMYTLLTALGMAAGYALLRVEAEDDPTERLRWWSVFVLASVAALYTHYFATFLLASFGLYFALAWLMGRLRPRGRLLAEGMAAAAVVVAAYLPWLPNALRRFGEDASYWRGTLKLNEALRHVAISFTVGETMLEGQATPLAWAVVALAAVGAVALLWVGCRRRQPARAAGFSGRGEPPASGRLTGAERLTANTGASPSLPAAPPPCASTLFALIYLLGPLFSILLLSYTNPKFNPRYLMLASPAFLLLLAGGLSLPLSLTINRYPLTINRSARSARSTHSAHRSPLTVHRPPSLLSLLSFPSLLSFLSLALLLALFSAATRAWFTDPAFTKDDWRGAVFYVKSRLQPDERVVLVSGHAYPAWRYYAADVEPVRLPEIETLDVNAVLDLRAAEALNAALAGRRGAWLVQWQAEVVDPNGVVPFLLDTAGDAQPADASFWGLGAPQHYRFAGAVGQETAFPTGLPLTAAYGGQALNVNFGGQVALLGYSQPPCAQPFCPVYLFWQALQPLTADLKLTAALYGPTTDEVWSAPVDRRLAAYAYPTFRWQPGVAVLSRLEVPADLGTPPGKYRLRLGVYDAASGQALDLLDAAGAAQGRWAWLEPVVVQGLVTEGPNGPPADAQPIVAAPGVQLLALTADRTEAEPGEPIWLNTWWRAVRPVELDYPFGYGWVEPGGGVQMDGRRSSPAAQGFPTSQWPAGAVVRGQLSIYLPLDMAPGLQTLRLGLLEPSGGQGDSPFAGETATLPITVLPSTRRFQPSAAFDVGAAAAFASAIELLGARWESDPTDLRPGATLAIVLGWRATQRVEASYTGFVHLLDAAGRLVAQDDHVPLGGRKPTDTWVVGEVVEDPYVLPLPADLSPGVYRLVAGLYDAGRAGLPRLRTGDGRDHVLLAEVTVQR